MNFSSKHSTVRLDRWHFLAFFCVAICVCQAGASEHFFAYSYEPETMPQNALEYEQWVSLRAGRSATVGQENYTLWELREELEYGITDRYTVSLYLNESAENFRDPMTGNNDSSFHFDGVSLENRYMVLNPAEHAVGLALYVEPRYSGDQAEVEEKIILGQRHGDWKWAFNITHATEWSDNLSSREGEFEVSVGMVRFLGHHWSAGLEARDHNELPDYARWENTALYFGPVATYRQEKWWVTLAVTPQIYGVNFIGVPTGSNRLDLEGHERWNSRLIVGVSF
ncbi:MAG: hypothetical protein C5B50_16910 [Verrucomicrobia bacterium]|nr:MAG: hypothetical protein C5B50_16910 [Verrucomicrobiota bacterium]